MGSNNYNHQYTQFQAALSEAIQCTTQCGLDLLAANPGRFANLAGQPFTRYLPNLALDLQTPAFQQLLSLTHQTFGGLPEPSGVESLELARFTFWHSIQAANDQLDWTHPLRVARNAVSIGSEMDWSHNRLLDLYWGALFHDVGKLFIEELEDRLTTQGYDQSIILALIRTHAAFGGLFMATMQPLFPLGALCAAQHQESVDGSGYPAGLTYKQISKEGIIVNLADGYDATVTRKDWSAEQVCREEQAFYRQAGYPDAPELCAFLAVILQYHAIWYPISKAV